MPPTHDPLEPDDAARRDWDALPKSAPSKQALPPMGGGLGWAWLWLLVFGVVLLLGWAAQAGWLSWLGL